LAILALAILAIGARFAILTIAPVLPLGPGAALLASFGRRIIAVCRAVAIGLVRRPLVGHRLGVVIVLGVVVAILGGPILATRLAGILLPLALVG